MKRLRGCAFAALVGGGLLVATGAHAADIVIPLDTVISSGVAEGDTFELALIAAGDLDGETCAVSTIHGGRADVHPGNDLVVRSGADRTVLADVERESGAETAGASPITLSNTITVELEMGPDQHFGGDLELTFVCGDQVAALRATPEQAADDDDDVGDGDDGGVLPFTGGQITVTLAIAVGLIAGAVALMTITRRRPSPPGSSAAS